MSIGHGHDHPGSGADMVNRGMNLAQIKAASPAQGYTRRYGSDTGSWTTSLFVEAVHRSLTKERR